MNAKLSWIVFCAVAVAGWSFAGLSTTQDPAPKPVSLEAEVAKLKSEVADLKQKHETELAKQRSEIDFLTTWVKTQAQAGTTLQGVLDDSRDKGFTAGINPESRIALLGGLQSFAESMKSGVPEAAAAGDEVDDEDASSRRTPPTKKP